jgi:glycosyltransferase involved in cell wall biosynthesis
VIRDVDLIYANDQLCGLVALGARRLWRIPFIYDAHEMMPFRARKNGICRMAFEAMSERQIVAEAVTCYVVNKPICKFYQSVYRRQTISIRLNDFYPATSLAIRSNGCRTILYIGASNEHRGLMLLDRLAAVSVAHRVLVFPDQSGEHQVGVTQIGLADYPSRLPEVLAGSMPYMWCCFNASILSYRYSLPNKFFQALAYGIPVIVGKGTYLERLVRRYGIGVIFDDDVGGRMWNSATYENMSSNVVRLREEIHANRVHI